MNDFHLNDSFPPTTPGFHRRMEETLHNLKEAESMKKRKKMTIALAVALIGAMALAGLAYAASQTGLIDRLFRGAQPSQEAAKLVTPLNLSATEGGVTYTLEEYLFDETGLYVGWSLQTDSREPVIVTTAHIASTLGFENLNDNQMPESLDLWTGVVLDADEEDTVFSDRYQATSWAGLVNGLPAEPFDVTMTAFVIKPDMPMIPSEEAESGGTYLLLDEYNAAMTVSFASSFTREADGSSEYKPLDVERYSDESLEDAHVTSKAWLDAYERALVGEGYASQVKRIDLTFTVAPDAANITHTEIQGDNRFVFDDFTVELTRVDFSPSSTHIDYIVTVHAPDGSYEDLYESKYFKRFIELYVDGEHVQMEKMQGAEDESSFSGEMWGPPLTEIPDSVTLILMQPGELEKDNVLLEEYTMEVKLNKLSANP